MGEKTHKKPLRRFLRRFLPFLFPLIIYVLFPCVLLLITKENFYPPPDDFQDNKLIGYAYNQDNIRFLKWDRLQHHKKFDVLVLGSSRVLQFRRQMFNVPFYNAGLSVAHISDYRQFLKEIPKINLPKYLLLGIEQWEFNSAFNNVIVRDWKDKFRVFPNKEKLNSIYSDLFSSVYSIKYMVSNSNKNNYGIFAVTRNNGFRSDGSRKYGNHVDKLINYPEKYDSLKFEDVKYRINEGSKRFNFFNSIKHSALKELDSLLIFCKSNNIITTGIVPPFPQTILNKMNQSGNYPEFFTFFSSVDSVFIKNKIELFDYTNPTSFGSSNAEFLDGFHGGEVCYLRLLINMLEKGSVLNEITDVESLKKQLSVRRNNFEVYGD